MTRALGTVALIVASFLGAMFLILVSLVFAGPPATIGALLALTLLGAWRGRRTYYGPAPDALDAAAVRAAADMADEQARVAHEVTGRVFDHYAVPREPTPGRERLGL